MTTIPPVRVRSKGDDFDIHVWWLCVALAAGLFGMFLQAYIERHSRPAPTVCAQHLDDGRKLMAYHLGVLGQERCVYEAPRPQKGKRFP